MEEKQKKHAAAIAFTARGCVCVDSCGQVKGDAGGWIGEEGVWVKGGRGGPVGWLEDLRSPAGGFSICLLACSFFLFFFFISNRKERILVAVLRTHLVRGTKTAIKEKRKVHVSVNVNWVGKKKQNFNKKMRCFNMLIQSLTVFVCSAQGD